MNYGGQILNHMEGLVRLLAPHCDDRSTIDALGTMLTNHQTWSKAHDLFNEIRVKALVADRAADRKRSTQYLFEEICAKTLFNMSGTNAPFDADSPYWIIPNALAFAKCVGVSDAQVIKVIA
jgi:hypothetical protein